MNRMKKKTVAIILTAIMAAAIATAFVIIHKPVPKPDPLASMKPKIHLNDSLSNALSDQPELAGLDKKVRNYMRQWQMKGASLAIMRNDSLLYAKGYGWADEGEGTEMEPSHILRMASVSKLITAVGIMVLQDRDSLSIKDTVFGPSGILNDSLFNAVIKDKNYHKITVEHLLRHQGGFYRDPLFSSNDVRTQMQLDHPPLLERSRNPARFCSRPWVPRDRRRSRLPRAGDAGGSEHPAFLQGTLQEIMAVQKQKKNGVTMVTPFLLGKISCPQRRGLSTW